MMRMSHPVITAPLLVLLAACGGGASTGGSEASSGDEETASSGPSRPVNEKGSGSVAATIGSAGGSLELTEGPRVVIPSGATSSEMEYALQDAPLTTAFGNEEKEKPVGPTFVFSPGVASEGDPIEVSIPFGAMPKGWGEPALAYEYGVGNRVGAEDSQHTRWQYEDASYTGGRLVANVSELTGMRLQFVLTNLEVQ